MDDGWVCDSCHSINGARAKSCYSCHKPREQPASTPTVPNVPESTLPSSVASVTRGGTGVALPSPSSDTEMTQQRSVESAAATLISDQSARFCASCGVRLPPGAQFCPSCGHQVREDSRDLASAPIASSESGQSALQTPTPPKPTRKVPIRTLALGAVVLGGLALVAFVATRGVPGATHTLTGYLNLAQQQGTGISNYTIPSGSDTNCEGLGGYSDIRAGAQLVVKDEAGKVIGSGSLDQGHLDLDLFGAGAICGFPFTVTGLPKVEQYQLGMGNRGSITYSFADLETAKWEVKLTLGP